MVACITALDVLEDLGLGGSKDTSNTSRTITYDAPICLHRRDSAPADSDDHRAICGVVALNCVRLIHKLGAECLEDSDFLDRVISQSTVHEIMSIAYELNVNGHLSINQLLEIPIFEETLEVSGSMTKISSRDALKSLIEQWFSTNSKHVSAAVFRTSEMFVCLRMPISETAIFALFDCHPRSSHPHSPAFTLSASLDGIAAHLFSQMSVDPITMESTSSYQFSAHLLKLRPTADEVALPASINKSIGCPSKATFLEETASSRAASDHANFLQQRTAVLADIQNIISTVTANQDSSLNDIPSTWNYGESFSPRELSSKLSLLRSGKDPKDESLRKNKQKRRLGMIDWSSFDSDNRDTPSPPGPQHFALLDDYPFAPMSDQKDDASDNEPYPSSPGPSGFQHVDVEDQASGSCSDYRSKTRCSAEERRSWESALLMQLQEEEEIAATVPLPSWQNHNWLIALQRRIHEEEIARSRPGPSSSSPAYDLDFELAMQLQREEAAGGDGGSLSGHNHANDVFITLTPRAQVTSFDCCICRDTHAMTQSVTLPECQHIFCRECLRTLVETKLDERRYPIFCPECVIERSRTVKSHVTQEIIELLELSSRLMERLGELQLLAHSIILNCPRCNESMNVDRAQYNEEAVLVCPVPRCGHTWCKTCLKALASSQDNHRCRNDNIDRLMRRKGWKYCPGCQTPVQKESGCNHMTCAAPGCNVHFCYRCGVLIVDTTNGGDVGLTVTEHYANCRLFEKRWKCTIQ